MPSKVSLLFTNLYNNCFHLLCVQLLFSSSGTVVHSQYTFLCGPGSTCTLYLHSSTLESYSLDLPDICPSGSLKHILSGSSRMWRTGSLFLIVSCVLEVCCFSCHSHACHNPLAALPPFGIAVPSTRYGTCSGGLSSELSRRLISYSLLTVLLQVLRIIGLPLFSRMWCCCCLFSLWSTGILNAFLQSSCLATWFPSFTCVADFSCLNAVLHICLLLCCLPSFFSLFVKIMLHFNTGFKITVCLKNLPPPTNLVSPLYSIVQSFCENMEHSADACWILLTKSCDFDRQILVTIFECIF